MKKMLRLIVSLDMPSPKMIKKEKEYIRRKLIKKDFRVLSFEEVEEMKKGTSKIAELLAEQILDDNYWDLFAADEEEKNALELEPWGRIMVTNLRYKPKLEQILTKKK